MKNFRATLHDREDGSWFTMYIKANTLEEAREYFDRLSLLSNQYIIVEEVPWIGW